MFQNSFSQIYAYYYYAYYYFFILIKKVDFFLNTETLGIATGNRQFKKSDTQRV